MTDYTYPYPRAALTVDAIVFVRERIPVLTDSKNHDGIINETLVLLIRRGNEPFKNMWALPGGFIEMDELLEDACKRELLEETGIKVEKMTQFKTYDEVDRDPRHRTISVVFTTELENREEVEGGDDAAQADWFCLDSLPQLAFDHQQILEDFKTMLKEKA